MTWTAPPVVRGEQLSALGITAERRMLEGWLDDIERR